MIDQAILKKLQSLPDSLKSEIIDFIKFLDEKSHLTQKEKIFPEYESLKGTFKIFADFDNGGFKKLFEAAEIAKFTPQERVAYEESLKYYRDLKNVVDTSRQEGILEGWEQGIEQGIEQGVSKRNLEIAIQMKRDGEPTEKIMKYTNLTREQIEKL